MLTFLVTDMTCGHCVSTITKAINEVAPNATIQTDLKKHIVEVQGADNANDIQEALSEAGFNPALI